MIDFISSVDTKNPIPLLLSGIIPQITMSLDTPSSFSRLVYKNEKNMTLMKVATLKFNKWLLERPDDSIFSIDVDINSKNERYYYRVHDIKFVETLDLSYEHITMNISTTNNDFFKKSLKDSGIRFTLDGKLTFGSNNELNSINIIGIKTMVNGSCFVPVIKVEEKEERKSGNLSWIQMLKNKILLTGC
jgi:hypothetical protein